VRAHLFDICNILWKSFIIIIILTISILAAPIQPLPTSHLIFRVSSQGAGKCWMDALELALKCSSLLIRSMSTRSTNIGEGLVSDLASGHPISGASASQSGDLHWNDSDFEKHFKDQGKMQFLLFFLNVRPPIPS
jgi:hypothetical protein